jgi:hypothetical protein
MGDQPTSGKDRTPEEAAAEPADARPDETVVIPAVKKAADDTVIIRLPGSPAKAGTATKKKTVGDDTVIIRLPDPPKSGAAKPKAANALTTVRKQAGEDTVIIRLPQAAKKKAAGRVAVDEKLARDETVVIRPSPGPGRAARRASAGRPGCWRCPASAWCWSPWRTPAAATRPPGP